MPKLLQILFDGAAQETTAKIQVRRRGDGIWRDHTFVSNEPQAVQSGLVAACRAFRDADVRAVDQYGRMIDFR